VLEHQKEKVADLIGFPVTVSDGERKFVINNKKEFLFYYDLIFDKALLKTIPEFAADTATVRNILAEQYPNPEYDITKAIRKTLYSYQGEGDLFSNLSKKISFTGFISQENALPEQLVNLKNGLNTLLEEMKQSGGDRFDYNFQDPEADNGGLAAQLEQEYGFRPMAASLFDQRTFWFYMILESGDQVIEIPLPQELDKESLKRSFDSALKRFATGFTKNIALHSQPVTPPMPQYGMPGRGKQFNMLKEILSQEHAVSEAELKDGFVPEQADLLILSSPEKLDEKQLFAVDQFLMQGGTVILATSPFDIEMRRQLSLVDYESGLDDWLAHHGITIEKQLVMDSQNSPFPVPTQRTVAGFTIQETKMIDYPYFLDVRKDGMNSESPLFSGIQQLTLNWSSPIAMDESTNNQRTYTRLLESSSDSWLTSEKIVQPDFKLYPELGFAQGETTGKQLVGVMVEGSFSSFFKDKESPLLKVEEDSNDASQNSGQESKESEKQVISRIVQKSPATSRIICFSSNSFLSDAILSLGSGLRRTAYLEPVQMIANAVDWSLEDSALLEIRGRSHFSRPLHPLSRDGQLFFEYLNYGLAILGLIVVWIVRGIIRKRGKNREQQLLQLIEGRV